MRARPTNIDPMPRCRSRSCSSASDRSACARSRRSGANVSLEIATPNPIENACVCADRDRLASFTAISFIERAWSLGTEGRTRAKSRSSPALRQKTSRCQLERLWSANSWPSLARVAPPQVGRVRTDLEYRTRSHSRESSPHGPALLTICLRPFVGCPGSIPAHLTARPTQFNGLSGVTQPRGLPRPRSLRS